MNSAIFFSILKKHVPAEAVSYCVHLWEDHPFQFKLRKSRVSKVGDFSCRPGREPRITVNADSHPFLFLITYVHEVAHLYVHKQLGWRAAPHGKEWKKTFHQLCLPLLQGDIFPPDLNQVLKHHLQNPKASSFSDPALSKALRQYDHHSLGATVLADIPEGSEFQIRGRWFTKGKLKRTRVVCRDLKSHRNYLIAADAVVGNA